MLKTNRTTLLMLAAGVLAGAGLGVTQAWLGLASETAGHQGRPTEGVVVHPEHDSTSTLHATSASNVARVIGLHDDMVEGQLSLIDATLLQATASGNDVAYRYTPLGVAWSAAGSALPSATTAWSRNLPEADLSYLQSAVLPKPVLMVVAATGEVLGIAPESTPAGELLAVNPTGVIYLGDVAQELSGGSDNPTRSPNHCASPGAALPAVASPRAALLRYLNALGTTSQAAQQARQQQLVSTAEALVQNAPNFRDPVTGDSVAVSPNGVLAQLQAGVAPTSVVLAPSIPVRVSLPTTDSTDVLVFIDTVSDDVLGWIGLSELPRDTNGAVTGSTVDIEIAPPAHDVRVVTRSSEGNFDCKGSNDGQVLMTVPHEIVAGQCQRAELDVATRTFNKWFPNASC